MMDDLKKKIEELFEDYSKSKYYIFSPFVVEKIDEDEGIIYIKIRVNEKTHVRDIITIGTEMLANMPTFAAIIYKIAGREEPHIITSKMTAEDAARAYNEDVAMVSGYGSNLRESAYHYYHDSDAEFYAKGDETILATCADSEVVEAGKNLDEQRDVIAGLAEEIKKKEAEIARLQAEINSLTATAESIEKSAQDNFNKAFVECYSRKILERRQLMLKEAQRSCPKQNKIDQKGE